MTDLSLLLAGLDPSLDPELYAFCRLGPGVPPRLDSLGMFRADEGTMVILPRPAADRDGLVVGGCTISRVLDPAPPAGREAFTLEYRAVSPERLRQYQNRHAPGLQRAHRERYAGRFEASRSVREVLASGRPGPG